jgi:hypothetical protein
MAVYILECLHAGAYVYPVLAEYVGCPDGRAVACVRSMLLGSHWKRK